MPGRSARGWVVEGKGVPRRSRRTPCREVWLYTALMEDSRSSGLLIATFADMEEASFQRIHIPNCSIALVRNTVLPPKWPSQRTFFLLRDPNYKLVRALLTRRKRGACKAGAALFSDCGKTAILAQSCYEKRT